MKTVVDCNVLIAASITDGTCRAALRDILLDHEIVLNNEILEEYIEVSKRNKFRKYREYLEKIILLIGEIGTFITPVDSGAPFDDLDDKIYLDVAVTSKANYLVTGNIRHFPAPQFKDVQIVTPREYLEML